MLRAIVHSKDRPIKISQENSEIAKEINFRSIYPQTEDFFTAAVFSRLCYLEGNAIAKVFSDCTDLDFDFGILKERYFGAHAYACLWGRT